MNRSQSTLRKSSRRPAHSESTAQARFDSAKAIAVDSTTEAAKVRQREQIHGKFMALSPAEQLSKTSVGPTACCSNYLSRKEATEGTFHRSFHYLDKV